MGSCISLDGTSSFQSEYRHRPPRYYQYDPKSNARSSHGGSYKTRSYYSDSEDSLELPARYSKQKISLDYNSDSTRRKRKRRRRRPDGYAPPHYQAASSMSSTVTSTPHRNVSRAQRPPLRPPPPPPPPPRWPPPLRSLSYSSRPRESERRNTDREGSVVHPVRMDRPGHVRW